MEFKLSKIKVNNPDELTPNQLKDIEEHNIAVERMENGDFISEYGDLRELLRPEVIYGLGQFYLTGRYSNIVQGRVNYAKPLTEKERKFNLLLEIE